MKTRVDIRETQCAQCGVYMFARWSTERPQYVWVETNSVFCPQCGYQAVDPGDFNSDLHDDTLGAWATLR
jgi:hypothetical protein